MKQKLSFRDIQKALAAMNNSATLFSKYHGITEKSYPNVFITLKGLRGTGKSKVMKEVSKLLKKKEHKP